MLGGWLPAILGLLVFGAMLFYVLSARGHVHKRMDNPQARIMPRDIADRARDQPR